MSENDVDPSGRPVRRPQGGPAAWRPDDLAVAEWTVVLDDAQRGAIVAAVDRVDRDGLSLDELAVGDRSAFPLGDLEPQVAAWSDALASGRGFLLIRRFPIDLPRSVASAFECTAGPRSVRSIVPRRSPARP